MMSPANKKARTSLPKSLLDLPPELIACILDFLPLESFLSLYATHSKLHDILKDEQLWKYAILDRGCGSSVFDNSCLTTGVFRSTKDVFATCTPYDSYRDLYRQVLKPFGWMIGTWAGDAQWMGSMLEVFYNSQAGTIECKRIQPWAHFDEDKPFSLDHNIAIRTIHTVMETRGDESEFVLGRGRMTGMSTVRRVYSRTNETSNPTFDHSWPTSRFPRGLDCFGVDTMAMDEPSCDLIRVDRPLLARSARTPGPSHKELYFRIPKVVTVDHAFDDYTGMFIGDYSVHGPEVLLIHCPTPTTMSAVKVTGDINVPRGEETWKIDDLSTPSRICTEEEWPGAKAYNGWGQLSAPGFSTPAWIQVEIILHRFETVGRPRNPYMPQLAVSQNGDGDDDLQPHVRPGIVVWWKAMRHMSQFRKIDGIEPGGPIITIEYGLDVVGVLDVDDQ